MRNEGLTRIEVNAMIQAAIASVYANANNLLGLAQSHAISANTAAVGLGSTVNTVLSVNITPKVTGKFRIQAMGVLQNGSTTQQSCQFNIQTQTTTGAAASTVFGGTPIEIPGTSTVGYGTPIVNFVVQTELTSAIAQPVGVPGVIILQAQISSGATNTMSVNAPSTLDVQEIL